MSKRGFTILELIMVIGVIAVLLTIVITTVQGSIKRARLQQAYALCMLAQNGFSTYYAQKGEWPWGKQKLQSDANTGVHVLDPSLVRKAFYEIVKEAKLNRNPVMDISGLFVSKHPGEPGSTDLGMDFMTAIHGTRRSPQRYKASELYYGYAEPETGHFRRFVVTYFPVTDSVEVRLFSLQEEAEGWQKLQDEKNKKK